MRARRMQSRYRATEAARYPAHREAILEARRERRQRRKALEADPRARRCTCGRAIPPEQWFCSVRCKAATAKEIVGLDREEARG